MRVEQFFHKYANTPLIDREESIDGFQNLNDFYFKLSKLQDKMRPLRIERDRLLRLLDKHYEENK